MISTAHEAECVHRLGGVQLEAKGMYNGLRGNEKGALAGSFVYAEDSVLSSVTRGIINEYSFSLCKAIALVFSRSILAKFI